MVEKLQEGDVWLMRFPIHDWLMERCRITAFDPPKLHLESIELNGLVNGYYRVGKDIEFIRKVKS